MKQSFSMISKETLEKSYKKMKFPVIYIIYRKNLLKDQEKHIVIKLKDSKVINYKPLY